MRLVRVLLTIVVLLGVVGLAAGGFYLWFASAVAAPGPLAAPVTVIIAPGSGVNTIARQLTDAGVIPSSWMFALEARRTDQARALKPGEYRFDAAISLDAALTKIVRREVVPHYVTIPEGLTKEDVLRILDAAEGLQGEAAADLHDGDLLPETYRYEWGDQRNVLLARMRAARDALLSELWANRTPSLPLASPEEAMVLASLIEKETALPDERPRIAAVFINRLKAGMRLQSDPTVLYGMGPEASGHVLNRADLERPTPFNTYTINGLPPSPICDPGKAAIAAALHPADTQDLYFVADGEGGHAFAASLAEHNRNVAHWRNLQRDDEAEPDD